MMNNMNNFGMNPMNINPLLMNNANNIGMNIQPNLMDNTALNIKSIIQPYENKIRELEEIIKQKDFEIIVLKQKLNTIQKNNFINMNMMNPMMNMNMMNPMMNINVMNPSNLTFNDAIFINFESNIKNFKCFKNEKISEIKKRLHLVYNYQPLEYDKTLEENGILNGSILGITDRVYNITFQISSNGIKKLIFLGGNCPINYAIKLFCELFKDKNVYQYILSNKIRLIESAYIININDNRCLKDLFLSRYNPIILVNDGGGVIGG